MKRKENLIEFIKNCKKEPIFCISKEESTYMKAFSIMFVVLAHILNNCIGKSAVKVSALLGTGGVWIFLALSGYGLFCSYKSKGLETKGYWNNKINNIFGPYILVTILYFLYLYANQTSISIIILVKNIFCIDFTRNMDGTMWYMSFILLWYVLFFVSFYFEYPVIAKIAVLFVCAYIFANDYYAEIFDECNWQFVTNAYAFPLGVLCGYLSTKQFLCIKEKTKKILRIVLVFICLSIYVMGYYDRISLTYGQYGVLLFISIYSLIKRRFLRCNCIRNCLFFIGKHSYIIYLVEGKFMGILAKYFLPDKPIVFMVGVLWTTYLFLIVYDGIQKSKLWKILSEN